MRIGFDAKRYFLNKSGLGNYSRDLIRILETYYPQNEYIKYTPKFIGLGDDTVKTPSGILASTFPSLWRNKWIVSDLVKDQIDIYHGLSGEIPVGLDHTNIKSVVTIHDLIFLKLPHLYKPIDRAIYNKKFRYAVNHADKVVAISQQTKQDIVEYYNVEDGRIEVIYQGCHPAFKIPKSQEAKDQLRRQYNLPQNFILNVGSIEPRKNAFQIVKAIETLDIPLIVIGKETKYSDSIKKYIEERGLQGRIQLLQGFTMEELSKIYAMAEAFVYPSMYEGFGIPIIEALYSGTPVITTRSGVFPEAGGPSSLYVDPQNIEELRHAIEKVLQDSSLSHKMIHDGLEYVQQFNDDKIAAQWDALYHTLS